MKKIVSLFLLFSLACASVFAQTKKYDQVLSDKGLDKKNLYYFSLSDGKKLVFAPGNLQYQPSTKTWRFAKKQTEYLGKANEKTSPDSKEWLDLFGWGTSGYKGSLPTMMDIDDDKYGPKFVENSPAANFDLNSGASRAYDWGSNAIQEVYYDSIKKKEVTVTYASNEWRTLSKDEWIYILTDRKVGEDDFGWMVVNADKNGELVRGVILFPDNFNKPRYGKDFIFGDAINVCKMPFSYLEFLLKEAGCVFLPCAGIRDHTSVFDENRFSSYWTSSAEEVDKFAGNITYSRRSFKGHRASRSCGCSVRLVHDL